MIQLPAMRALTENGFVNFVPFIAERQSPDNNVAFFYGKRRPFHKNAIAINDCLHP